MAADAGAATEADIAEAAAGSNGTGCADAAGCKKAGNSAAPVIKGRVSVQDRAGGAGWAAGERAEAQMASRGATVENKRDFIKASSKLRGDSVALIAVVTVIDNADNKAETTPRQDKSNRSDSVCENGRNADFLSSFDETNFAQGKSFRAGVRVVSEGAFRIIVLAGGGAFCGESVPVSNATSRKSNLATP